MAFSVTILGSGSATPLPNRNPSAHVIHFHERLFLFDCAEGTQNQMLRYHIKFQRLHSIFISHLHGDHFFGLIGLLSTLHLLGRKQELQVFGPVGLEAIIQLQLDASDTRLQYPLTFIALEPGLKGIIADEKDYYITTFPLLHSIPTHGFVLREKAGKRRIRKDFIEKFHPPVEDILHIKDGQDFTDVEGKDYPNLDITQPPLHASSYAYCSDTAYFPEIIPYVREVDVLYHEATFTIDKKDIAHEKMHATAAEAASIAKEARVGHLLLGHFSARYRFLDELQPFLTEAGEIFPSVSLATDGRNLSIDQIL